MTKSRTDNKFQFRPFWFAASSYYFLLLLFALILAFVTWLIFQDSEDETSIIIAVSVFVVIFVTGIFIRGKLKRRVQTKILIGNNKLNEKFIIKKKAKVEKKLTIPINAKIIAEIEKKSEAANLLGNLSEVHWEVFEICNDYLEMIESELKTVGTGSPRITALVKGREKIRRLHKKHLLDWVALESGELTKNTNLMPTLGEKVIGGNRALMVLESALEFYPNEKKITDSILAINEFVSSTKVAESVENAEIAASQNDIPAAVRFYRDALFQLASEHIRISEKEDVAARINQEINKLRSRKQVL